MKSAGGGAITVESVSAIAASVLGHPLTIESSWLAEQLDPRRFVEMRAIPGGPAHSAVEKSIAAARSRLAADEDASIAAVTQVQAAAEERSTLIDKLVAEAA